jgi:hypothetical protein
MGGHAFGGGALYRVNPSSGAYVELGESDLLSNWKHATVMASDGKNLFIVCGSMSQAGGGGALYRVNPSSGAYVELGESNWLSNWKNATVMASDGKNLFIVCGSMRGTCGGGALHRINPHSGASVEIGSGNWKNATVMASDGKNLFIVCGRMGGACGGGALYRVNPSSGAYVELGESTWLSNWNTATMMASDGKNLFIICSQMAGANGRGTLYRVNPSSGASVQLGGSNDWFTAAVMSA